MYQRCWTTKCPAKDIQLWRCRKTMNIFTYSMTPFSTVQMTSDSVIFAKRRSICHQTHFSSMFSSENTPPLSGYPRHTMYPPPKSKHDMSNAFSKLMTPSKATLCKIYQRCYCTVGFACSKHLITLCFNTLHERKVYRTCKASVYTGAVSYIVFTAACVCPDIFVNSDPVYAKMEPGVAGEIFNRIGVSCRKSWRFRTSDHV